MGEFLKWAVFNGSAVLAGGRDLVCPRLVDALRPLGQLNHQTPQDQPAGQASPTSPLKLNDVRQSCPLLTLLVTPAL